MQILCIRNISPNKEVNRIEGSAIRVSSPSIANKELYIIPTSKNFLNIKFYRRQLKPCLMGWYFPSRDERLPTYTIDFEYEYYLKISHTHNPHGDGKTCDRIIKIPNTINGG